MTDSLPTMGNTALPTAEPPASKRNHLESLTGLRIFAAVAVYFSHLPTPGDVPNWFTTMLRSGYMGVTVFFVLSGFVLALNYNEHFRERPGWNIWNFAVARVARVYPLYIIVLAYVALKLHADGLSLTGLQWHVLGLQAWSSDFAIAYGFNQPAWSVSVELFLYACFPILIVLLAKLRRPRTILLSLVATGIVMLLVAAWFTATDRVPTPASTLGLDHLWLYQRPIGRVGDFLLGILAAKLFLNVAPGLTIAKVGPWIGAAAVAVILALMAWPANLFSAWSWDAAYAIPATVLILSLAVSPASPLARFLARPAIVLLGEASYAFYLIHLIVLPLLGGGRWGFGFTPTNVLFEAFTLGILFALAIGLHIAIERPARAWVRSRFTRNVPLLPAAPKAPAAGS